MCALKLSWWSMSPLRQRKQTILMPQSETPSLIFFMECFSCKDESRYKVRISWSRTDLKEEGTSTFLFLRARNLWRTRNHLAVSGHRRSEFLILLSLNYHAILWKIIIVSVCFLHGLWFRIIRLLDWLPFKSIEPSVPCYLFRSCESEQNLNKAGQFQLLHRYHFTTPHVLKPGLYI